MTAVFVEERLTGYGPSSASVRYITVWDKCFFQEDSPMRFFTGDATTVFECAMHKNGTFVITTYPMSNREKIMSVVKAQEGILVGMMKEIVKSYGEDVPYPFFIKKVADMEIPIQFSLSDFPGFYPHYNKQDELFVFENPANGDQLPQIYFMPANLRTGPTANLFDIYAYTSHEVLQQVVTTDYGKEFTFLLYSHRILREIPREIPDLRDIEFPTTGSSEIPRNLKIDRMLDIVTRSGADKVLLNPEKKTNDTAIILPPRHESNFPEDGLEGNLIRGSLEKSMVNLSDVMQYGIKETLTLLKGTNYITHVFIDVMGMVKSMCFYEGQAHVILCDNTDSPEELFGESEELFHICDAETFPRSIIQNK